MVALVSLVETDLLDQCYLSRRSQRSCSTCREPLRLPRVYHPYSPRPSKHRPLNTRLKLDLSRSQLESFLAFILTSSPKTNSLTSRLSRHGYLPLSLRLICRGKTRTYSIRRPTTLRSIAIQSCDFFGVGRGFVKLRAEGSNDDGGRLPAKCSPSKRQRCDAPCLAA
jgi:hypothetical protein